LHRFRPADGDRLARGAEQDEQRFNIAFEERGVHKLKGVGEWRLYAVSEHRVSE